jgi:chemotaxis response regulator CheB
MFVTQILVVDDFLPWQRLVSRMFESEPNLKIIAFASEGLEAVQPKSCSRT